MAGQKIRIRLKSYDHEVIMKIYFSIRKYIVFIKVKSNTTSSYRNSSTFIK